MIIAPFTAPVNQNNCANRAPPCATFKFKAKSEKLKVAAHGARAALRANRAPPCSPVLSTEHAPHRAGAKSIDKPNLSFRDAGFASRNLAFAIG